MDIRIFALRNQINWVSNTGVQSKFVLSSLLRSDHLGLRFREKQAARAHNTSRGPQQGTCLVTAIKVLNVYGSVLEDLYSKEVSFMSYEASLISCKADLLSSSASLTYIFDFSLQSKGGESIFQPRKSLATFLWWCTLWPPQ